MTRRSVYSGRECIGFLRDRGEAGCEALNASEKSLGIFPDQQAAADAISVALDHVAMRASGRKEFPAASGRAHRSQFGRSVKRRASNEQ
jgi:hypothetical protein